MVALRFPVDDSVSKSFSGFYSSTSIIRQWCSSTLWPVVQRASFSNSLTSFTIPEHDMGPLFVSSLFTVRNFPNATAANFLSNRQNNFINQCFHFFYIQISSLAPIFEVVKSALLNDLKIKAKTRKILRFQKEKSVTQET